MGKEDQIRILRQGAEVWNKWTAENRSEHIDLSGEDLSHTILSNARLGMADLRESDFHGAELIETNFFGADLGGADLSKANLCKADFHGANLTKANLRGALLLDADLVAYLGGADLSGANLDGANLRRARLTEAKLIKADLTGANLREAKLIKADLTDANLSGANLSEANLEGAILTGCNIYAISAWGLILKDTTQSDLVITPSGQPVVTVDNLEVAQFVYLLLHNEKIRNAIDAIGKKTVLILGRFTPERKVVLDALRNELRQKGYLPILFDFEKPSTKDFTETIKILAGMSLFVIADISNPKSSPLELQATIPDYMVPFVPIIQDGEEPFSMFKDLYTKYEKWILVPLKYKSCDDLIKTLEEGIIKPALQKHRELLAEKAAGLPHRVTSEYL